MADITTMIAGGLGNSWVIIANIATWTFYIGIFVVLFILFILVEDLGRCLFSSSNDSVEYLSLKKL